jgi:hypothetical protein
MYNFKEIADELNIGREIEFEYNDNKYSITNSVDGYWYLYDDTKKIELLKICEFSDKMTLISKLSTFKIEEIEIQEIFNLSKYNMDKLYIL